MPPRGTAPPQPSRQFPRRALDDDRMGIGMRLGLEALPELHLQECVESVLPFFRLDRWLPAWSPLGNERNWPYHGRRGANAKTGISKNENRRLARLAARVAAVLVRFPVGDWPPVPVRLPA
jgi:hypothetical protein